METRFTVPSAAVVPQSVQQTLSTVVADPNSGQGRTNLFSSERRLGGSLQFGKAVKANHVLGIMDTSAVLAAGGYPFGPGSGLEKGLPVDKLVKNKVQDQPKLEDPQPPVVRRKPCEVRPMKKFQTPNPSSVATFIPRPRFIRPPKPKVFFADGGDKNGAVHWISAEWSQLLPEFMSAGVLEDPENPMYPFVGPHDNLSPPVLRGFGDYIESVLGFSIY